MTATLTNLVNDLDLCVLCGDIPTASTAECIPYLGSNQNEICTFDDPTSGSWYIMVHGFSAGSGTLTVSYIVEGAGTGQIAELNTSLSGTPKVGVPITFTGGSGGGNTYYRFLFKAGYGTAAWDTCQWLIARDWNSSNTATVTFPNEDNYCVIIQAAEAPNARNAGDPQGG